MRHQPTQSDDVSGSGGSGCISGAGAGGLLPSHCGRGSACAGGTMRNHGLRSGAGAGDGAGSNPGNDAMAEGATYCPTGGCQLSAQPARATTKTTGRTGLSTARFIPRPVASAASIPSIVGEQYIATFYARLPVTL
jgi:hypothetical protein